MRIVRTARAEEDLIDVLTYIGLDGELAAYRVLDELERKTTLLASNPNIGRERFDIAAGVRSLVSGSYLILYRILTDEVDSPLCSCAATIEGTGMKMLIGKMPPVSISLERGVG